MKNEVKNTIDEMKEIAIWLNQGDVGESSKYLLSRCLNDSADNLKLYLPYYTCDVVRCFKLYQQVSLVRNNIKKLYNDKIYAVIPIYRILFEDEYPLYVKNPDKYEFNFSQLEKPIQILKYLSNSGIKFEVINDKITYSDDDYRYEVSDSYISKINIKEEQEKEKILENNLIILDLVKNLKLKNFDDLQFDDIKLLLTTKYDFYYINSSTGHFLSSLNEHQRVEEWKQKKKELC